MTQFEQAGLSFEEIVRKVKETFRTINGISHSSAEQASKASGVMQEIESVAAISEEAAAAASQELAKLAEKLNGSVETFNCR